MNDNINNNNNIKYGGDCQNAIVCYYEILLRHNTDSKEEEVTTEE